MSGYDSDYVKNIEVMAELEDVFFLAKDEVTLVQNVPQYWRVTIPDATTPAALLSRTLKTYDGGGVKYRVFTATTGTPVASPVKIPAAAHAKTLFERVTGITEDGDDPADLDWISVTATGNNAPGGQAGGQRLRCQPANAVFYLSAVTDSAQDRDLLVELGWIEGPLVSKKIRMS